MRTKTIPLLLCLIPAIVFALPSGPTGSAVVRWSYDYTGGGTNAASATVNLFRVYYGIVGGSNSNIVSVATSATNPTISAALGGLTRGATYYIEVTASNPTDESDPSNVANYTVPKKPNPPTGTTTAAQ